jgi:hypothetical protein
MSSYLKKEEFDHLVIDDLMNGVKAMILYRGVMNTRMSIARFYGGMNCNGVRYTYMPHTDELIRDDVLKAVAKMRKDALKASAKEQAEKQKELL